MDTPIRIIEHEKRYYLLFETKWQGEPKTLGVSGAPEGGYASKAEAMEAKKRVSILRAGGITAATLLF